MKIRFFRWYNAVLTALLAVLGYGCSKDEPMDMYGTPTARYHLSGTVADETGKRIDGILISIEEKNGNYWENLISKTVRNRPLKYDKKTRVISFN